MPRGGVPGESRVSLNFRSGVGFSTLMLGRTPRFLQLRKRGKERSRPVDSTQFVLLLLILFILQWSFSPCLVLFCFGVFLVWFSTQIGMDFFFPSLFLYFFFFFFRSSVFPGSSDLRAVISHPAIETTQRMAHDQSLSALIYSSRKTHSA